MGLSGLLRPCGASIVNPPCTSTCASGRGQALAGAWHNGHAWTLLQTWPWTEHHIDHEAGEMYIFSAM